VLTDNEKSVTVEQVARIPVRNPHIVTFARYYGVTVLTCQVRDPASKGGVENAVKLAKADIVPTETNLRKSYSSFGDLEAACTASMTSVNTRVHRATRRVPTEMLTQEVLRLHPVPEPRTRKRSGNPDGGGEHPDGDLPGWVLLGARLVDGTDRVGPGPRRRPG